MLLPSNACSHFKGGLPLTSQSSIASIRKFVVGVLAVALCLSQTSCLHRSRGSGDLQFYEEVGAQSQEVYEAAMYILEPHGLKVQDGKKLILETKWIEDRVVREKNFYVSKGPGNYIRQYRMRVSLKAWPRYTEIRIDTHLRYKPVDATIATPWRTLKPERQDYELKRDVFQKILAQMEIRRKAQS